ncbi:MAG: SDR family oxidoreductase [Spirochaetia bacterium]|jgi:NADH dehydrogenase
MILVAGSTGTLGEMICRLLAGKGIQVRALVRPTSNKETVKSLAGLGAEIAEGDVRDSASLARACKGAQTVLSTISSMPTRYVAGENDIASVDSHGVKELIGAARAAGVERFIFMSFTADNLFPLREAKREAERILMSSGMTYTVLRASFFMETWLSPMVGFDYEKGTARILGTGENPVSFISVKDVAHFAVASLDTPAAIDAVVPLGGPEAISPNAVVKVFEEIGGRAFTVETMTAAAIAAQQKEATDPMQQSFAGLMLALSGGDAVAMTNTTRDFGVRQTSVRDYAKEVLPQTVRR